MQFSTSALVLFAALSGSVLAAPSPTLSLARRDCDCDAASACRQQCSAFNVGMGGGISEGMCILQCEPASGCAENSCSGANASGAGKKGKGTNSKTSGGRAGGGRG